MSLPWSDPTLGRGVYPAEAPFYTPAAISPYMVALIARQREQQQKQIADAFQQAIAGVGQYMQKRQQDQIASSLLAGSAEKPNVVSWPSIETQGATGGQLTPAEIAQNKALGFPSTQIATPTQSYAGHEQWQKDVEDSTKQWYDQAYKQAQIQHLNQLGYGGGGSGGQTNPTVDPSTGLIWNGRQWVKPPASARTAPTAQNKTSAEMAGFGLQPGDLDNIDVGKSDVIPPKGNAGQKMLVVTKDGRQATVPWATWQRWTNVSKLNQSDINQAAAALNNQAPLPAPDVPAADYSNTIPTAEPKVASQADFDALPSGATYIGTDGKRYRKP